MCITCRIFKNRKVSITRSNKVTCSCHELSKNKNTHSQSSLVINVSGKDIFNLNERADHFNTFFINIGSNLASKIKTKGKEDFRSYLTFNNKGGNFKFKRVSEKDVNHIILNLKPKTTTGYDNLSPKLIKSISHIISKPITLLINQSFKSGIFPTKLKIAKVIPIYKKGDPKLIENYRPISLLPTISIIFERVAYNQLS